ncbi:hypothetical protein GP486_005383 [Trichoglossum hirsutum]|uniref:Uncharacterized protein n=1 Tax=Trichoglossum hirsutum TaxID=265104 RepID=A0A9P8RMV0_9PEZI|nr:hypothetical protein GP486_005383 [Trichoglossum hirsutum]
MEEGAPEGKAAAIPKFASFRPKKHDTDRRITPDNGHDQSTHRKQEPTPSEEPSYGQQGDRGGHRKHRERHERHHRHRRSVNEDQSNPVPAKSPDVDPKITAWDDSPEVYVVDTKGDPKNLVYGAIHRYSLPAYYRAGAGHVIGLDKGNKIDRELSSEKGIVIQNRSSRAVGNRDKYAFSRNERKGIKKLRIKPFDNDDAAFEATLNFIPLRLARGVNQKQLETGSLSSNEDDDHHYRSIEGKAKAGSQPEDKDLEYASESSTSGYEGIEGSRDEATQRRNIELSQRVEAEPLNVDAWLELVDHQDSLVGDRSGRRKLTSAEQLSTADIKLSMYEKALDKVGKSAGRERLLVGLMEEGSKIWE